MTKLYKTRPYKTVLLSLFFLLPIMLAHDSLAAASEDIVYGDIVFESHGASKELLAPYFPHWKHRIRYRCSVCHEKIFIMERGGNEMNMGLFKEGKFCGECHDGQEAFKIGFGTCNRCHSKKITEKPKP